MISYVYEEREVEYKFDYTEFATNCALVQHIHAIYTSIKNYKCNICNCTFKTKTRVANHKLIHKQGALPYHFQQCTENFASKASHKVHISLDHKRVSKIPFKWSFAT